MPEGAEAPTLYTRIAQQLARLLQERTADGFVHRVDYRLRPDPGSTPTAVSLPSAYTYYETVGQNWERAALIKARPIAGDIALGERFLEDLRPFIWRKYFDFASIADVHAMKRQIHAVRGHDQIAVAGHDIKLGRGGIREIEFFVQTQQLVFGGRRPALRGRRTLDMLVALRDENWITDQARDELSHAYRFLRTVEHRLQMVADEQTQRLPSDETGSHPLRAFLRLCRPRVLLDRADRAGAESCSAIMRCCSRRARSLPPTSAIWCSPERRTIPRRWQRSARLGFHEPERAAETIRGWHFGRRSAITSQRAREVLTEFVPALLSALGGTPDPDAALAALDRAFGRMPAVVELLTILQSHDRLRLLFADLLGTAPRLADTVAQSPHVLDALIDPAFVDPLSDDAGHRRAGAADHRQARRITRSFSIASRDAARQMRFVTGARLLSDILSPTRAGEAYAAIAQRHRARARSPKCDGISRPITGSFRAPKSPSWVSAASVRANSRQDPISTSW